MTSDQRSMMKALKDLRKHYYLSYRWYLLENDLGVDDLSFYEFLVGIEGVEP